jgi:hypothetical protein
MVLHDAQLPEELCDCMATTRDLISRHSFGMDTSGCYLLLVMRFFIKSQEERKGAIVNQEFVPS